MAMRVKTENQICSQHEDTPSFAGQHHKSVAHTLLSVPLDEAL